MNTANLQLEGVYAVLAALLARSVSTILRQAGFEFKLGFLRVEMAG
jgi:hypothetical protein